MTSPEQYWKNDVTTPHRRREFDKRLEVESVIDALEKDSSYIAQAYVELYRLGLRDEDISRIVGKFEHKHEEK